MMYINLMNSFIFLALFIFYIMNLKRRCSVCGKKLEILVDSEGRISGGVYFGKIDIPYGRGRWIKVGASRILGYKSDIVEWTGKARKVEYWECRKCYEE